MKNKTIEIAALFITAFSISACTNTERATGSGTAEVRSTEVEATQATSGSQQRTDTDMSEESKTEQHVSAHHKLGSDQSIMALLQQNQNLTIFVDLIRAADMIVTLESPAPYTVFAPTNQAFASLPTGTIETLKAPGNKTELTRLLQAHILPNQIASAEIKDNMSMVTATGQNVVAKKSGTTITVGGAQLIITDVKAANGVVHVIDKLLVPPEK